MQPLLYNVGVNKDFLLFSVHYGDGREARLHLPIPNERSVLEAYSPIMLYRLCIYELLDKGKPRLAIFPSMSSNSIPISYGDGRTAGLIFIKPNRGRRSFSDRQSFTRCVQEFEKILRTIINSPNGIADPTPPGTLTIKSASGRSLLTELAT